MDHGRKIHYCLWALPVAGRTSRVEDRPGQRGLPGASVQVPLVTRGHYLVRVRTSAHSQRHHSLCADRGPVSLTAYPSWAKVVDAVGVADCQCPAVACPVHVLCCLHVLLQQYAPILRLRFSITFILLSHSLPPPPASLCICPPHNVTRPKSSSSCLCSTPHHAALPSESLLQNVKNVRGRLSMFHIHPLNLYSCIYNSPHSSHLFTMFKIVLLFVEL